MFAEELGGNASRRRQEENRARRRKLKQEQLKKSHCPQQQVDVTTTTTATTTTTVVDQPPTKQSSVVTTIEESSTRQLLEPKNGNDNLPLTAAAAANPSNKGLSAVEIANIQRQQRHEIQAQKTSIYYHPVFLSIASIEYECITRTG
jgi:hypothetical protein